MQISTDDGVEVSPTPLASGKQHRGAVLRRRAAGVDRHRARRPAATTKVVFPTLHRRISRQAAHVDAGDRDHARRPDGLEIHNQLFLPKDLKPGEKRPAIVFVHGGPSRQMLPAYHYMQFYHWAYALQPVARSPGLHRDVGQLSQRHRLRQFVPPRAEHRRPRQLRVSGRRSPARSICRRRADVDPARVGIWGLSYGGLLTAEALARNSDIFVAGVDLAGVHIYGNALDTTSLAFRSSAVGAIDGWKSPVFLVHGDDDRNVDFAQTVGLVELLRARGRVLRADRDPGRRARVADPQPLDRHLQPKQRLPAPVRVGQADAAGDDVERQVALSHDRRRDWTGGSPPVRRRWRSNDRSIPSRLQTRRKSTTPSRLPVDCRTRSRRCSRDDAGALGGRDRVSRVLDTALGLGPRFRLADAQGELGTLANNFYEPRRDDAQQRLRPSASACFAALWWAHRDLVRRIGGMRRGA